MTRGSTSSDVSLSIAVQKMVRSDSAYSGVIFSIDTETGFKESVFITGAYGLGENVVQGIVNPDEYYVFKPTLKQGKRSIISRKAGDRDIKMVYSMEDDATVKNVATTLTERHRYVLEEDEILQLAEWACLIEDHYTEEAGYFKPHGHRVGQGRRRGDGGHGKAVHRAGASRDDPLQARVEEPLRELPAGRDGGDPGDGDGGRYEGRSRGGERDRDDGRDPPFREGPGPGDEHDGPGLGAPS